MKFELRFRAGDDVRLLWIAALCVLIGGAYYVQTHYQVAIGASHDRTELLYRQTVANVRIAAESASLRAIESRAESDLTRVSHDSSLSASTASLLSTLNASAKTFDTRIVELRSGDVMPAQSGEKDDTLTAKALQATPVTIRVRGKFGDILRFVEDLSHHATLINVSDTEMTVANDDEIKSPEPRLDATVHATMYRLVMQGGKELRVASAR